MIQPLLFVYSLFSVCTFLMCSAGNSGLWSGAGNALSLNNILMNKGWKNVVAKALDRELKSINGEKMDVSELLNRGADGKIVTPANYTDKLLKTSTVVSCFFSENLKFMNDLVIDVIGQHCMSLGSDALKLDCMEQFWETMDKNKSWIEKMLFVLNYFHKASKATGTTTVIDVLEFLLPRFDRQQYIKSNYLDDNDTIKIDNLRSDYDFFLEQIKCANKLLQDFLMARCLSTFNAENEKSEDAKDLERMAYLASHDSMNFVFNFYDTNLRTFEKSFFTKLGFKKKQLRS
ncbi:uncharacterized protein LOC126841668 [Adelges cooleyi]|uniref:uncharacterized protein LOC126839998 n=1 Tax=Adelges cooleyi TaxID=133065 RepID=UPI0021807C62|nr:uncharacterized protein LOC126839998 [Adelges cooleyi]XP_050434220.1 uncharacterized protein LOC126841668 [Adelges cooleyi]